MTEREDNQNREATDRLPPRVDLRSSLPPIRDQGARGTCLAFAVTAAHELERAADVEIAEDLSEEFLYWGCKQIDGDHEPGSTFASAAEALAHWGQPPENLWPYDGERDDGDDAYAPPPAALAPANCYKARLRHVDATVSEIKRWVTAGRVVMLGIRLSKDFYSPVEGRIPMPASRDELEEGHAIVVVGYDDGPGPEPGVLILRNSWGPEWGDEGHCYLPYGYIDRYGGEAWIVDRDARDEPVR